LAGSGVAIWSMTGDRQRIAEIEALFRAGNDRMMGWEERRQAAVRGERLTFFCECGRRRCREHVHLTADEYEAVRVESRRFIVAPGHELPAAENVVERHDRYFVVEKHEEVWAIVERMDLRTDPGDDP
jgi:hypothetical protein